jgi:O-antigen ligase
MRAILGVLVAVLVFAPAAFGAVRGTEYVLVQWALLVMTGLALTRLFVKEKFRFWLPPGLWSVVPFVAYAAWRYATADIEFIARQEFIQIAFAALLLFLIVTNLYEQEAQRTIVWALITVATLLSMYGIYQWLSGSTRSGLYPGRAAATYVCPNHFAGFVEMCLPLAVALAIGARISAVKRILLIYAAAVMFVGIAASGSRGGWVGCMASMAVLLVIVAQRKGLRWAAIGLAVFVCIGGYWTYQRTIKERVDSGVMFGPLRETRSMIWTSAYRMWRDHFWTGVGPDHFDARYRAYREPHDKAQGRPGRAHCDYLNTLTDYGVIGLALALLPIGVLGWSAVRSWPHLRRSSDTLGRKSESTRAAVVLGAACGLIALLAHSLVDFNMHIPANALTAVVLMGLIAAHTRFATSRWWLTARWPVQIIAAVALPATLWFGGKETFTRTRESYALRDAEKLPDASAAQIAALKRAAAFEPKNPETPYLIGERVRAVAFQGADGYEKFATEAIPWYQRAIALNRWDPLALIGCGQSLDWIERHDEALPYYERAVALDPNYYYTRAMLGWHYFQTGDLNRAEEWNEKSIRMNFLFNPHAYTYRELIARAIERQKRENAPR